MYFHDENILFNFVSSPFQSKGKLGRGYEHKQAKEYVEKGQK